MVIAKAGRTGIGRPPLAVTSAQVAWREEFAGGQRFGDAGSYELVRYRMAVALDPDAPANAAITDIQHAARSARGHVEAETDVLLLRPAGNRRGNGCLLCVVPNRGTTGGMPFSYDEPPRFGAEPGLRPGDGWLLRSPSLAAGPQWAGLSSLTGNSLPFPLAESDANVAGDQRRPVSARYRDRDDYLAALSAAARQLAAEGFLLTEDIDRVIAAASARYDLLRPSSTRLKVT